MTDETRLTGLVLEDRGVIAMEGGDARTILQDTVTANVDALAPGRAVYTALLTPQGKYLFDFFLLDAGDGRVLIDVKAARAVELAKRLSIYCVRRDARLASGPRWRTAQIWGGVGDDIRGGESAAALIVRDPRDAALGWRVYSEDADAALAAMGARAADPGALAALRVANAIPETDVELISGDTYVLEAGFERLGGVDFRKGCYVGQEVTARMRHRAELRKGLVRVAVRGAPPPGTPVTADGKPVGTLFTVSGGAGLAHLRLDRAGPGMIAGEATIDYPADAPAVS